MPNNAIKGLGAGFRKRTWADPLPGVWIVVGTVVSGVPRVSIPPTPIIVDDLVIGPRGLYRMSNATTLASFEEIRVPPFSLYEYASPGDSVSVEYMNTSLDGPLIALPITPQILLTAVGTLSRTADTVTLTPATWDTGGITVTRQKVINDVATALVGLTFTVAVGETYRVIETASKSGMLNSDPAQTDVFTRPPASPVYVGGKAVARTTTSVNYVVSLTDLTGGTDAAPQPGDLVIVSYTTGWSTGPDTQSFVTADYTVIADLFADYGTNTAFIAGWKVMGATPDATVEVGGRGTFYSNGVTIHVWRGVDQTTPMDVTPVTKKLNGGRATFNSITPVTSGAVLVMMAGSACPDTYGAFTSDLENFRTAIAGSGNPASVGVGSAPWVSGTYAPAGWLGHTTDNAASYGSVVLALRPAA